jgi:hypothetical protein
MVLFIIQTHTHTHTVAHSCTHTHTHTHTHTIIYLILSWFYGVMYCIFRLIFIWSRIVLFIPKVDPSLLVLVTWPWKLSMGNTKTMICPTISQVVCGDFESECVCLFVFSDPHVLTFLFATQKWGSGWCSWEAGRECAKWNERGRGTARGIDLWPSWSLGIRWVGKVCTLLFLWLCGCVCIEMEESCAGG